MTERKSQIKCVLCRKTIIGNEKEELKEKQTIMEIMDGTSYTFDTDDCVLMFKKFRSLYGTDFIKPSQSVRTRTGRNLTWDLPTIKAGRSFGALIGHLYQYLKILLDQMMV
jgi:hypothetical protein